jgi:hypothetical protein
LFRFNIMKMIGMVGKVFGKWTVVARAGSSHRSPTWTCQCECGKRKEVVGKTLRNGDSTSCGCQAPLLISKARTRHGYARLGQVTPTWRTWAGIIRRCTNPHDKAFKRYGAKGITICDRWKVFENFLEDMGERPEGLTIDRINGRLGYFKENCRWATQKEQQNNRLNNMTIAYRGEHKTVSEWADCLNIKAHTLANRIRLGWTPEDTIEKPIAKWNREEKPTVVQAELL